MIQTQQHLLSDEDRSTLRDWFASPSFQILMRVIKSEQAFVQAEAGAYYMSIGRKIDMEDRRKFQEKAHFLGNAADDLQFMIEKLEEMQKDKYEFKTTSLTP